MPTYTQETRALAIDSPLGTDALLLTGFSGQEEMSRLFRFDLELCSDKTKKHDVTQIVGKNVTFWVEFPDGEPRYFNGVVKRFSYGGTDDRVSHYRAEVVPWLWLLTRTSDCRIWQEKSIPEIIEEIFGENGFSDFDKSGISGSHQKWEYCVQYRETDFNFVSRLMEHEGIFYYFKHEQGKHTLMLGDSKSAYKDAQDKEVQFLANMSQPEPTDQIRAWEHQYEFKSGKWAHTDYNFETPTTNILAEQKGKLPLSDSSKWEFFDFPGEYEKKGEGTGDATLRIEQEEAGYDVVSGQSICRSFGPGFKFKLTKHHNSAEQGKGYVLTSVQHQARQGGAYVSGVAPEQVIYGNSFTCIPDSVPFRPERLTPKSVIQGVQTAVVTGPSGQEIHCDKYGRIKVQFHWDRKGKKDEKSSCWIRCAQFSAGKGWGMMSIPRIGQEVVVTYLEGDPDRPLVTGVVYNESQMPAYKLPDEKTKMCFKSNSSPGGSGFNEVRFEDRGGKEQFFMHAQNDMDVLVLNDLRESIMRDMHLTVERDQRVKIKKDQSVAIDGKLQQVVGSDMMTWIKGEEHRAIDGVIAHENGGTVSILNRQDKIEVCEANCQFEVTNTLYEKTGSHLIEASQSIHIKAGTTMLLEAGVQLSLKVGGNFVDISPAGVAINGMPVTLINSGGAAGAMPVPPTTVAGMAPGQATPDVPDEADKTAVTGQKSAT